MKSIDCFIPWQSDKQAKGTLECLKAEPNINEIHFLQEESIGNTKTIKHIAETACAPYTLIYTKYDTLQLGYHALTPKVEGVNIPETRTTTFVCIAEVFNWRYLV